MSLVLLNRAKMTVSGTPGTGTITLNAASTGFQSFATAGIHDGARVPYLIEDGSDWEYGLGDYTTSGTTLARTVILGSSNSGSAISATSSATVAVVPMGQVFPTHAGAAIGSFSGAYNYSDLVRTTDTDGRSIVANVLIFSPITIGMRRTFTRIGIRSSGFTSSASARLGIYRDSNAGGAPGRLLLDAGTVTIAAASTIYEITISQLLDPGLYWLAFVANGTTAQVISINSSSASLSTLGASSTGSPFTRLQRSFTYGSLPSDETSGGASPDSVNFSPVVHLRIA